MYKEEVGWVTEECRDQELCLSNSDYNNSSGTICSEQQTFFLGYIAIPPSLY
jgi:hypothetical protein